MATTALDGTSWHVEAFDPPVYLDALGLSHLADAQSTADADLLAQVHGAHVRTFPFSTVDVLLGEHPA